MNPTLKVLLSIALAVMTIYLIGLFTPKLRTDRAIKVGPLEIALTLTLLMFLYTFYLNVMSLYNLQAALSS